MGFAADIKLIEKIGLSQEKEIIQASVSFAVPQDDTFIIMDVKAANIKIFNRKGELIKVWGRKGPGPKEFFAPLSCAYRNGTLAVMDVMKKRVFLFDTTGKTGLTFKQSLVCTGVGLGIALMENGVLIAGSKVDLKGKPYDLYIQGFNKNEFTFLLPYGIKWERPAFEPVLKTYAKRPDIRALGSDSLCDWAGNYAYYVWKGNLRIIKINIKTAEISYFGKQTANYIKPVGTKKMLQLKMQQRSKLLYKEKSKMSFVRDIFATENYVGVLYNTPAKKVGDSGDLSSKFILQLYSHEGKFLNEVTVSDKYAELFMKQEGDYIYFLCMATDDYFDNDYDILKYRVVE
jgi:hypothetical protein